jgi:hypothetical protein
MATFWHTFHHDGKIREVRQEGAQPLLNQLLLSCVSTSSLKYQYASSQTSMAYKGGTSLALLWLTNRPPILPLPRLIQEVPDLALLWLTPEVPVLTLLRLTVKVLTLLRLTQEVPVPIPTPLTQEVPLAVEHISPQVRIFVLQLKIHLGKQRNNLVIN